MFSVCQRGIDAVRRDRTKARLLSLVALIVFGKLVTACSSVQGPSVDANPQSEAAHRTLRVCANPNNLPFSNHREQGFENRIASLLAKDMHAKLQYVWRPDRRGYIKRTLDAQLCDLVMAVPSIDQRVLTTVPYYESAYVFVTRPGEDLKLHSFDDEALRRLRIGLHVLGDDGFNPLPVHALARRGVNNNIVGYPLMQDASVESPGSKIIDGVSSGQIDVAIVWGPFGGFFSKLQQPPLDVHPVELGAADTVPEGMHAIAMGVRKKDEALKREIDTIVLRRLEAIQAILKEFGVPEVKRGRNH